MGLQSQQIKSPIGQTLGVLRPEDLLQGGFRTWGLARGQGGKSAIAIGSQDFLFHQESGDLLTDIGPLEGAILADPFDKVLQVVVEPCQVSQRHGSPLVGQHRHGDLPALSKRTNNVLALGQGPAEKNLTELRLPGNLPDGADFDSLLMERNQKEGDPSVAVIGIGASQDKDPIRPGRKGGPHLLAFKPKVFAIGLGSGAQCGQIASGVRFAESLAPNLLPRKHLGNKAPALFFGGMVNERRTQQIDSHAGSDGWRMNGLGGENCILDHRESPPSPFLGPVDPQVAGLIELGLPTSANVEKLLLVIVGVAKFLDPGTLKIFFEPGPQLHSKLLLFFAKTEIHPSTPSESR